MMFLEIWNDTTLKKSMYYYDQVDVLSVLSVLGNN